MSTDARSSEIDRHNEFVADQSKKTDWSLLTSVKLITFPPSTHTCSECEMRVKSLPHPPPSPQRGFINLSCSNWSNYVNTGERRTGFPSAAKCNEEISWTPTMGRQLRESRWCDDEKNVHTRLEFLEVVEVLRARAEAQKSFVTFVVSLLDLERFSPSDRTVSTWEISNIVVAARLQLHLTQQFITNNFIAFFQKKFLKYLLFEPSHHAMLWCYAKRATWRRSSYFFNRVKCCERLMSSTWAWCCEASLSLFESACGALWLLCFYWFDQRPIHWASREKKVD